MKTKAPKLTSRSIAVANLREPQLRRMYTILDTYYSGVSWEKFNEDLSEKDHVILMEHPWRGIVGFSTVMWKRMDVLGRSVIGVFSGDTILEKEFWGSSALKTRFLAYIWGLKLRHPFTPVFWFLISKGYKTYLLMAKNLHHSYPRPDRVTPAFEQALMDRFYSSKFPSNYDRMTGVISFGLEPDACKLKGAVAPITPQMRDQYPLVDFFESRNPGWEIGNELACVAEMTAGSAVAIVLKILGLGGRSSGNRRQVQVVSARASRPALATWWRRAIGRLGPARKSAARERRAHGD